MKRAVAVALVLLSTSAFVGCRTQANYISPQGPRYVAPPPAVPAAVQIDTLRVVTFNIEFSLQIDRAIALMTSDSAMRDADIILLQEMNEQGTRRIAEAFGMGYVYYPATFHLKHKRDVGNAILSRFPVMEDAKIILPHVARNGGMQRITTAATLRVGNCDVRVYSAHLGTIINVGPERRRDQVRTILADARRYERVIFGGDMNDPNVSEVAEQAGYSWPTRKGPKTTPIGRFDHILFKGFETPGTNDAGTVMDVRGASDHRAVWAVGVLRQAP
jgi:endonuclease/exonuclease/phosphatase family metal-dependent hydrolase